MRILKEPITLTFRDGVRCFAEGEKVEISVIREEKGHCQTFPALPCQSGYTALAEKGGEHWWFDVAWFREFGEIRGREKNIVRFKFKNNRVADFVV